MLLFQALDKFAYSFANKKIHDLEAVGSSGDIIHIVICLNFSANRLHSQK